MPQKTPWRVGKALSTTVFNSENKLIAIVVSVEDDITEKDAIENARLMAAAPDLLAALETIANYTDPSKFYFVGIEGIHRLAKEAIAKTKV